ncbi:MAG: DUF4367 domain-containing protein [Bacteroidaceae bacterium]|nr:DUF4367 domain-containing protein [Bacteroidaceae bacterium]
MKITDEMLFEHAAEARDIWLSTLPDDEDIPDIPTSKKFEKKMQKLIKEQRRTPKTNKILRYMKQTVAAVLAVAILSFGGLMTVEAYREKVVEIVVHVFHELTDYRFASEKSEVGEVVLPEISFGYVPEGMEEITDNVFADNSRYIVYEDDDGNFFELTQTAIGSNGAFGTILDTEDSNYEMTSINGNEAFSNVKDGNASVLWNYDNVVYDLYGNIELTDLKNIAEKIKIIEN